MRRRPRWRRRALLLAPLPVLLLAWLAWQALHAPPPGVELDSGARLEWVECWFDPPPLRPVHCARLYTAPEPGATPARFALPVVYLPAPVWRRAGPPLQYIAGGPGGAAWLDADDIGFWFDWQDQTGWTGDLVLYDQRGVGLAEPALDCPEVRAERRALLPLPLDTEEAYRRLGAAARACHERLRAEGYDFSRFTTSHNAADAIALMRALGFERWDLYGVSYGTRVALEMMRRAPQRLRAVILDAPYPPQVNAELSDAWLLQRTLELFGRICDLVDACDSAPEQLDHHLRAALARLEREPLQLTVRDPDGGGELAVVYDHEDLAWLLFEALYDWEQIPRLPAAVEALAAGRIDAGLRRLVQDSVYALLDDSVSDPVASSVDCHDNAPVAWADFERELARYPRVAAIKRHDWHYGTCRFWASGSAPAAFRMPVTAPVPTLILAGEFDPVTPPEWAEMTARTLPAAHLFVFPEIGHGVLDSHACASDLTRAFLAAPHDPRPPACLDRL